MGLETLNKDSQIAVYNSGVSLTDKGVTRNHQGATVGLKKGILYFTKVTIGFN